MILGLQTAANKSVSRQYFETETERRPNHFLPALII